MLVWGRVQPLFLGGDEAAKYERPEKSLKITRKSAS